MCNVATGNPGNPLSAVFTFTNTAGWGSGGVDHYRYLWDQNPTETLTGSEAVWSGGTLPLTATAPGRWYLHLLSQNSGNVAGGTLDLGAYYSLDLPILTPKPAYAPGTSNTVAWAAVSGATAYYVECDNNSDFSSPEFNSGSIAGTSQTFTGLTAGATYYYHVKARMALPASAFIEGGWSNPQQVTQDVPPTSTISCPANGTLYNPAAWPDDIAGTSSDPVSSVGQVQVSIERLSNATYWDGTSFDQSNEYYLTALGTTAWTLAFADANLPADGSYTVHARGTDVSG